MDQFGPSWKRSLRFQLGSPDSHRNLAVCISTMAGEDCKGALQIFFTREDIREDLKAEFQTFIAILRQDLQQILGPSFEWMWAGWVGIGMLRGGGIPCIENKHEIQMFKCPLIGNKKAKSKF